MMNAYESLVSKISPFKIYEVKENSNIFCELSAYSVALDMHREMLEEALRECFISTSSTYGLENRELMVGNIKSGYELERRREMLIFRSMLGQGDFTAEGLGKFLKCFGVTDFQILEIPQENEIAITICGDYSDREKKWIERETQKVLPAHLSCKIYFSSLSWKSIDSKALTFALMDEKNYSWTEINNLIEEG